MKIGVIGGSGFIGSNLVDKLIENGHQVTVFDIMQPHRSDVRHVFIDIVDPVRTIVALTGGYDAVYLLAAMADVNDVHKSPVESGHVNIMAVANILEAARRNRIGRVILASTVWLYDLSPEVDVDEDTPLAIQDVNHVYTATKVAAEAYAWAYSKLYGLPITILRYGIPYGPRARESTVLAVFVGKALRGEPIGIHGSGKATRNYIYIDDLIEGNVAALQESGKNRCFNLEGKRAVTVTELAQAVTRLVKEVPITHTEAREGDFKGRRVSGARAAKELGWEPKVDLEEGIKRYLEWRLSEK